MHSAFTKCCQITFVSRNDARYSGNETNKEVIFQPLIEFKTCFMTASVPLSYFSKLGRAEDRIKAVDTWLLFEILNALGGYSII